MLPSHFLLSLLLAFRKRQQHVIKHNCLIEGNGGGGGGVLHAQGGGGEKVGF